MTKKELATKLADIANLSKQEALRAVEGFMVVMGDAFTAKDSVYLRSFGTFKVVTRKAKKARDIHKQQEVMVPERLSVKFTPCDALTNKMNRKW